MSVDRKYLVWGLCYIVVGMCVGIFMAASQNFAQKPTHVHILLVGFVVSFIYAVINKLWLQDVSPKLANIQFMVHQGGALLMFTGLFLLYGGVVPLPTIEPVLIVSSLTVLSAAVLMLVMVFKSLRRSAGAVSAAE